MYVVLEIISSDWNRRPIPKGRCTMNLRQFIITLSGVLILGFASAVSAQKTDCTEMLSVSFDLSKTHRVGEKERYRMQTVYLDMNDSGRVAQTRILKGNLSRETIRVTGGKAVQRISWDDVRWGSRQGKGPVTDFDSRDFTEYFTYDFSPQEWEPHHFPVDVSSIPKTMDGWMFVVKLIDFHTFDAILRFDSYTGNIEVPGDTAFLPAEGVPVVMDFPPLFTDTYFINAPFYTTFLGVTLYRGESCAMLGFRSDDCTVKLTTHVMDRDLPTYGVSYYWGDLLISLNSGDLLLGHIHERVDSITSAFIEQGQPMRSVTRREITLERIGG